MRFRYPVLMFLASIFLLPSPGFAARWKPARGRALPSSVTDCYNSGFADLTAKVGPSHTYPNVIKSASNIDLHVTETLVTEAQAIAVKPELKSYNGGTVVITSGYRNCARNGSTRGSAKNSAHLRGHAIDIRSHMRNPESYAKAIQATHTHKGGGYFNTCVAHVHLDTEHPTFQNECKSHLMFQRRKKRS